MVRIILATAFWTTEQIFTPNLFHFIVLASNYTHALDTYVQAQLTYKFIYSKFSQPCKVMAEAMGHIEGIKQERMSLKLIKILYAIDQLQL